MTVVAGLRFGFEPEEALSTAEREWLLRLPQGTKGPSRLPVVRIRLEPRRPGSGTAKVQPAPARVAWDGTRVQLSHASFEAALDPATGVAIVRRDPDSAAGLVTTLRMALSARLPLEGGVLVHAAGLERAGKALVFFGPSGVGKSTLAERSPWPALSDELVALLPRQDGEPWRVTGVTFPALSGDERASAIAPQLSCLIELAQATRFRLERLVPAAAFRGLVGSIVVPPSPALWTAALGVAGELTRRVACYGMAWSLDESPFEVLDDALA